MASSAPEEPRGPERGPERGPSPFPAESVPAGEDASLARLELVVSRLLRSGVFASLAMVLAGLVVMLVQHPEYLRSAEALAELRAPHETRQSLAELGEGLARGRGGAIAVLGVLMLVATPVLRVAASVVLFAVSRDRAFTLITTAVLVILLLSFVLGGL